MHPHPLEDLFVLPAWRGRGIGRALLRHLAGVAIERGCGRMEWSVLDWNDAAIGFYRSIGARPMDEWTVYRLTGDALRRVAESFTDRRPYVFWYHQAMKKTAARLLVGCVMWAVPASSQQPIVKSPPDTTAPDIPGVVAGGTKVQLIRDLFQSTEGPIAMPDGSLLFTEQDAGDGALVRIDTDGNISTYAQGYLGRAK